MSTQKEIDILFENTIQIIPDYIYILYKPIPIFTIDEKIKYKEIILTERLTNIWDNIQKCKLIESILLGLPINLIYSCIKENVWTIIDGAQRINTFTSFIYNEFSLQNLKFLTHLEGKKFEDLQLKYQRRIKNYTIQMHIINQDTPINIKYMILKYITNLNSQEIYTAVNSKNIYNKN